MIQSKKNKLSNKYGKKKYTRRRIKIYSANKKKTHKKRKLIKKIKLTKKANKKYLGGAPTKPRPTIDAMNNAIEKMNYKIKAKDEAEKTLLAAKKLYDAAHKNSTESTKDYRRQRDAITMARELGREVTDGEKADLEEARATMQTNLTAQQDANTNVNEAKKKVASVKGWRGDVARARNMIGDYLRIKARNSDDQLTDAEAKIIDSIPDNDDMWKNIQSLVTPMKELRSTLYPSDKNSPAITPLSSQEALAAAPTSPSPSSAAGPSSEAASPAAALPAAPPPIPPAPQDQGSGTIPPDPAPLANAPSAEITGSSLSTQLVSSADSNTIPDPTSGIGATISSQEALSAEFTPTSLTRAVPVGKPLGTNVKLSYMVPFGAQPEKHIKVITSYGMTNVILSDKMPDIIVTFYKPWPDTFYTYEEPKQYKDDKLGLIQFMEEIENNMLIMKQAQLNRSIAYDAKNIAMSDGDDNKSSKDINKKKCSQIS